MFVNENVQKDSEDLIVHNLAIPVVGERIAWKFAIVQMEVNVIDSQENVNARVERLDFIVIKTVLLEHGDRTVEMHVGNVSTMDNATKQPVSANALQDMSEPDATKV